jgi:predicted metal-dependent peptidase
MASSVIPNQGSQEAREAVVSAIMGCRKKVPYLGRILDQLRLEFRPDLDTVAETNGRYLRVNPNRMAAYQPSEQIGIVAHEALHVLFRHFERLSPAGGYEKGKANVAGDYAINGWLLGAGFDLPPDALYDSQFDNMGAVAIYRRLPDDDDEQEPGWGGFASGSDASPIEYGEISESAVSAGLAEILNRELGIKPRPSRFSLEKVLQRLLVSEPLWERTYHRENRAVEGLPSHIEVDRRPRVVTGLDVSGSISRKVREQFLGAHAKIETPVTAIAVDTRIVGTWRNVWRNNITPLAKGLPRTGGGTRFQPAIDFAAKENASLVYLTDGETSERHLEARGVPITWVVWGSQPAQAVMNPVGRVIMVEP